MRTHDLTTKRPRVIDRSAANGDAVSIRSVLRFTETPGEIAKISVALFPLVSGHLGKPLIVRLVPTASGEASRDCLAPKAVCERDDIAGRRRRESARSEPEPLSLASVTTRLLRSWRLSRIPATRGRSAGH